LGTAALSSDDFLHRAIEAADLIINVGHDVVEKPPFIMGNQAPKEGPLELVAQAGDAQVIHLNYVTATVDAVYYPQQGVIGDIANSLERLTQALEPQSHWDFSWFMQVKDRLDQQLLEGTEDARFPIYPQRLVHSLRRLMPEDGIVALDNGIYKIWFARNYRAYQPNTLLLDNALASMGAGLPSAMAAKMVCPGRKVVAVCGDGGFMMNSQELETAVRLKLDLTVLVLRDNAYGMIKWKQRNLGFEDFGLDFGNPDFVRYAQSYGAQGHRPESADDFEQILKHCLIAPGVHLIDVQVDYSENEQILHQDIKAQSRAMVDSPARKKETGT
ncbi:MAG: thiamine pyrophosphate-dependent enzyme, partial [Pseudomonadales bacterium]